jgi:hypothetical protein
MHHITGSSSRLAITLRQQKALFELGKDEQAAKQALSLLQKYLHHRRLCVLMISGFGERLVELKRSYPEEYAEHALELTKANITFTGWMEQHKPLFRHVFNTRISRVNAALPHEPYVEYIEAITYGLMFNFKPEKGTTLQQYLNVVLWLKSRSVFTNKHVPTELFLSIPLENVLGEKQGQVNDDDYSKYTLGATQILKIVLRTLTISLKQTWLSFGKRFKKPCFFKYIENQCVTNGPSGCFLKAVRYFSVRQSLCLLSFQPF